MLSARRINAVIKISIIILFFAFIPIAFIYSFLRDIQLLNSIFIDYVNSGTSFFLPFLSYPNIIFQFSIGHLIDIIIIINIIGFIETSGYQYYLNVCLRKTYFEAFSESNFLETNGTQVASSLNSDLILCLKDNSDNVLNDSSVEFNYCKKRRIKVNKFRNKIGYYNSSIIKIKHLNLIYLHNSSKKNTQHKNNYTFFQILSTNYFLKITIFSLILYYKFCLENDSIGGKI